MGVEQWTDSFLSEMRQAGDPLADEAVAEVFALDDVDRANRILRDFDLNCEAIPEGLPPKLKTYLERSSIKPEWTDMVQFERGNDLLGRYAPQLVMGLLCHSLPCCYVCADGAQVLMLSQRFQDYGRRRIMETTQFLLDVLDEGGMVAGGYGLRSIQKIRLMHATVRYHVVKDARWQPSWGLPINQEDLAGTMLTFCVLAPRAIERLGADLTVDQRESFIHVWRVIGAMLGMDDRMLPNDYAEAATLLDLILARNQRPSEAGRELTKALLEVLADIIPGTIVDGIPASLIRFFAGDAFAEMLAVPQANWTRHLIPPIRGASFLADKLGDHSPRMADFFKMFGNRLLKKTFRAMKGPNRYEWRIPKSIDEQWHVSGRRRRRAAH